MEILAAFAFAVIVTAGCAALMLFLAWSAGFDVDEIIRALTKH